MKGWYRDAVDRMPPHVQVNLKRIMTERVDLYRHVPPPGENIPVFVGPFLVEESVPR